MNCLIDMVALKLGLSERMAVELLNCCGVVIVIALLLFWGCNG